MRTLKDVNTEMYELIKDRTSFLSDGEEYIVDNLKSPVIDDNEISISYDESTAFKIVQQACDWIDTTDTENALWCAWYSSWYEAVLLKLVNHFRAMNICDEWWLPWKIFTSNDLEEMFNNLLKN